MKVLPFNAQCPEEKRDPDLVAKLLGEEHEGILAWAVNGARAWFDSRLSEPEAIKSAVKEYRKEEDVLLNFISERCKIGPALKENRKFLFDTYVDWSKANGYQRHWTQRKFALELQKLQGISPDESNRDWLGIDVNSFGEPATMGADK